MLIGKVTLACTNDLMSIIPLNICNIKPFDNAKVRRCSSEVNTSICPQFFLHPAEVNPMVPPPRNFPIIFHDVFNQKHVPDPAIDIISSFHFQSKQYESIVSGRRGVTLSDINVPYKEAELCGLA